MIVVDVVYCGVMFDVCRFFGLCFILKLIFWFLVRVLKFVL